VSPKVRTRKQSRSASSSILELILIIAIALGLALAIQAFIVKPYRIPSGSMEPTLKIEQRVLVDRIGERFSEPHVGEIAVFHPPVGAEQEQCGEAGQRRGYSSPCSLPVPKENEGVNFIKRVVAGPGDTIFIREGHLYRNGKREGDSFTYPCKGQPEEYCNFLTPIKVPAGHWFMMGDNRGKSDDSRFWGPVPTSWIVGEAFATYWPPDRIGFL
jgi:signal peptidase I